VHWKSTAGGVLAIPGPRRHHDKMQEGVADSGAWSRCWIASCSEEETRPEWPWAEMSFGWSSGLNLLQNKMNSGREMVRQVKVKGMGEMGGLGLTVDGGFERTRSHIWRTPASDFVSLAALSHREQEGKWRGGSGG
jgi:hypothetical protein